MSEIGPRLHVLFTETEEENVIRTLFRVSLSDKLNDVITGGQLIVQVAHNYNQLNEPIWENISDPIYSFDPTYSSENDNFHFTQFWKLLLISIDKVFKEIFQRAPKDATDNLDVSSADSIWQTGDDTFPARRAIFSPAKNNSLQIVGGRLLFERTINFNPPAKLNAQGKDWVADNESPLVRPLDIEQWKNIYLICARIDKILDANH